jgi:hypothetical protein
VGKLFDNNGTTLLNSVTAASTAITSGGIAFRATGNNKYWDTVQWTPGVNNFSRAPTAADRLGSEISLTGAATLGPAQPENGSRLRSRHALDKQLVDLLFGLGDYGAGTVERGAAVHHAKQWSAASWSERGWG